MPASDCPFDSTCFSELSGRCAELQTGDGSEGCPHRPSCESLKTLLKRDPDRSIGLAKEILLNGLPLHSHVVSKYLR